MNITDSEFRHVKQLEPCVKCHESQLQTFQPYMKHKLKIIFNNCHVFFQAYTECIIIKINIYISTREQTDISHHRASAFETRTENSKETTQ